MTNSEAKATINYQIPEGCRKLFVRPVHKLNGEGFCLFSMAEGIYFGNTRKTIDEAFKAADAENMRHEEFCRISDNHSKQGVSNG